MSYQPNIPTAGQTIKETQGPINTNFTVANTAFGIDHTDFATAVNQGEHQKVSLIARTAPPYPTVDPAAIAAGPIVYCKNTAYPGAVNHDDVYLREETGNASTILALTALFNDPVTAINGSSFLPGIPTATSAGAIIKWGFSTITGDGADSFVTPFPNNCFGMTAQTVNPGGGPTVVDQYVTIRAVSKTGFTATATKRTSKSSDTVGFFYIAIGN